MTSESTTETVQQTTEPSKSTSQTLPKTNEKTASVSYSLAGAGVLVAADLRNHPQKEIKKRGWEGGVPRS